MSHTTKMSESSLPSQSAAHTTNFDDGTEGRLTEHRPPSFETATVASGHPLARLSVQWKNVLMLIFAVAQFVDICNVAGVTVELSQLGEALGLRISQLIWIVTSYSLCFASFMLFAGRLSDLFPAHRIFQGGFVGLGIFSLATSFVHHSKYGFLILRGLGGICGAMTIPSATHLVVHMYPNSDERGKKLALLGLAFQIGNVVGSVLAGVTMLANPWWFFRVIAILCLLFGLAAMLLCPKMESAQRTDHRWKRMDFPGVLLLMAALICFILALTQGPIDGWHSAAFIAPFVLSIPLAMGFFVWESYIPPHSAVLPATIWKTKNIIISSLISLLGFPFWATSKVQYSTFWQRALGWSPLHVSVAVLPQCIIALIVGMAVQRFPAIIRKPRYTILVATLLYIAGELLQVFSNGGRGTDYWRFCFPAFILGSAGAILAYMGGSINLILYCPPEMGGVASALVQMLSIVGGAICMSVQAGMDTSDISDWKHSSARSFYFMVAWAAVLGTTYIAFYRHYGTPEEEHEEARARIAMSTKG